jgi:membrane-associated phospholipid phosphatase
VLGLAAFVLLAWAAGELWVASIGSAEADLMRSLAAARTDGLVEAARATTWAGSALVLVPLALVCCLLLLRADRARDAAAVAVGLGGGILIANLAKSLTGRARPAVEHLQHVTGSGFPSGHATQAGAFWTALLLAALAGGARRSPAWPARVAAGAVILAVAWSRSTSASTIPPTSSRVRRSAPGGRSSAAGRWPAARRPRPPRPDGGLASARPPRVQSGYSSLRQARKSSVAAFGVRSSRNE